MSTRGGRATTTSPLLAAAASDTTTSRLITAPSDKRAPASGREPRSEPRQEEGIMLTRGVRCSHQCISCDMHRLSAALRRLSARHDTTFLMPLPAATLMHSPVRLHPEAPSTRALMPTRISASPPPSASQKERPALEDHEPGVSATRRRRAPERAQTSKALLRKVSLVRKRARQNRHVACRARLLPSTHLLS